jgi:hypothetical protein
MSSGYSDDLLGNPMAEPVLELEESDDDFTVEVVDDTPEEDQVSSRATPQDIDHDDEVDNYSGRVKNRINKLKFEYHEERRSKEAAEKMREEAVTYAKQVHSQNEELRKVLEQGESVLLNEMKARAQGDLNSAREMYKTAYEQGDTDQVLIAQEKLNRSQRYSEMAENQGTIVPDHLRQPVQQGPPQPDPKLQGWMSKNEWFGKDNEMTSFAYGVHQTLVSSGVDPRSDEYYQKIDNRMQEKFSEKFGNERGEEVPVASSRTNTVVAPVNRSSGKPRQVQLSSTQVALAKRLGLTPEQYARQLLKEMR